MSDTGSAHWASSLLPFNVDLLFCIFFFYQKLEDEKKSVENSKLDVEDELDTLKKEQEDLLVLLADQDTKIDKYKTKLKELGQQVSNKKKK